MTEQIYNKCREKPSSLQFIRDSHVDMLSLSLYVMNFAGAAVFYGQSGIVTRFR